MSHLSVAKLPKHRSALLRINLSQGMVKGSPVAGPLEPALPVLSAIEGRVAKGPRHPRRAIGGGQSLPLK